MCRFEELCCRTPWRSHVLQGAPFLLFLLSLPTHPEQGDEITVLMQLTDEDGIFLVRFSLLPSEPTTAHVHSSSDRATVKVSLVALPPLMFSSPESSRRPLSQSVLPPRPNHPVRAL